MFSTAFLNDSAVGSGIPRGGARGGYAPFARGNYLNQDPYKCHFLASKMIAMYLSNSYICANFAKIWGWVVCKYYICKRMDFFTPPEIKGKFNKMCYY